MVFYCECASDFSNAFGFADVAYFRALLKMFEAALKVSVTLQNGQRGALFNRLDHVRSISQNLGYGLSDEMNIILAEYKDEIIEWSIAEYGTRYGRVIPTTAGNGGQTIMALAA